ncbi:rRNA methyltransferase [Hydrogenophaga crassostreae]|uniref:rRNA methyltransferase n=1 Tax=Hydrogenophaga crassostreae TaxID=1763535 RepID=A0A162W0Z9_9BURK|nr:RNA methyltransferase [Hydrogenophaga crassostreae]AOW15549.1 rRNA methyltransferase [Hydrogenophaga crassostreae]OAD42785.1 rRNA methyltransferase [Hydrogenophaga crassostreae]
MNEPAPIRSRDNPLLKRLRVLAQDNTAYRKQGQVWLEGDHLCRALMARQHLPSIAVFAESAWASADPALKHAAPKTHTVPDALMAGISGLESPAGMGFVWDLPSDLGVKTGVPTVVLDRLQDAGNVGSILRSAAAMGFAQVLAIKGTAALWSPKVLRAGMGAHFALRLVEGLAAEDLTTLNLPLLVTSSHEGEWLHETCLPCPCAWVMGHEGQGVGDAVAALATRSVRIIQPGGEESLNVAAAAAICLHASACAAQGIA